MELEADNRGITEILEKKSLELDLPATNSFKENRHPKKVKLFLSAHMKSSSEIHQTLLSYFSRLNIRTVGILKPDWSGLRMVHNCPVLKWSGFQMVVQNHSKTGHFSPVFEWQRYI